MGPAAWSAWHADAGSMMQQQEEGDGSPANYAPEWDPCAQWTSESFQPHPDLMVAEPGLNSLDWSQRPAQSAVWDYTQQDFPSSALGPWQIPTDGFSTEPSQEVHAALLHSSQDVPQNTSAAGSDTTPPQRLASPLMVPLPEPLQAGVFEMSLDGFDDLEEPQTIVPPPGLLGSAEPHQPEPATASAIVPLPATPAVSPLADHAPPGMTITPTSVDGNHCIRVEWLIQDLTSKLQACMGRPFVSPPFTACGLENLRFMVFPDARDAVKSARSRERKGLYAAMIKKGPLYGSLKLKADCLEHATILTFNLTVGVVRAGPLTYDFSEQAIHGLDDFGVDWLKQVEQGAGNLRVGIEILEVRLKGEKAKQTAAQPNQLG